MQKSRCNKRFFESRSKFDSCKTPTGAAMAFQARPFALPFAVFIILFAEAQSASSDELLFQTNDTAPVLAGRYSLIADFQVALANAAHLCGLDVGDPNAFGDGSIGGKTRKAVMRVATCDAFPQAFHPDTRTKGAISRDLWQAVAPSVPLPTAADRALVMTIANEGTDYTDVEFNVGTIDPGILTWGPLGATAADAALVQRILKTVDHKDPALIDGAFGPEAAYIRRLAASSATDAETLVVCVKADAVRRQAWLKGFAVLGTRAEVRAIYDAVVWGRGTSGIPEGIEDFFRSYWRQCKIPTEADYGFFLDRATHMAVFQNLTDDALGSVRTAEQRLGISFSPAQRRRAIAANFIGTNGHMVGDRLARDVAFYFDAIPEKDLTDGELWALRVSDKPVPEELRGEILLWKARSGRKASDFGLSDERPAVIPAGLTPPDCARGVTQ